MSAAVIDFPVRPIRRPRPILTVVATQREDDHAELVSALLLEIERQPLTPILCYPVRDIAGTGRVQVTVGQVVFNLNPDDCRTAADAIIHERGGEPGVLQTAGTLREAGNFADRRPAHGGPLVARPRLHRVGTGMVSTLSIAAVVLIAAAVDTLARIIG